MLSPDDIAQRRFLVSLRGYDREEVSTFLDEVADQVRGLRSRVAELEAELAHTTSDAPEGQDAASGFRALGEETTRILVAAQESARQIEGQATATAEQTRDTAQREARETVDRANAQAARTIAEAERRRDAVAAEIAQLHEERDRFLEGLRGAIASVHAIAGDLDGSAPPETVATAEAVDVPPAADVVVAAGHEGMAHAPAGQPLLLDVGSGDPTTTDEPVVAVGTPVADEAPQPEAPQAHGESEIPEGAVTPEGSATPEGPDDVGADDAPTVESRRQARLEGIRTDMTRQCKRGLQEIQNDVLASIREQGRGADLSDLLPGEPELDDLATQGAAHLAAAYNGGLEDAAAEVDGQVPDGLADGARVQTAAATFRAVIAHEVNSALRATLRAGLEAQEPEPQLSERVGEAFRDLRGPVVESAADEHLQRTYGHGLLDAWEQLGVSHLAWQSRPEPRCPEGRCRTNAAEGPVALGSDFPSGDRVPPAHTGCTCVVVPVGPYPSAT